MPGTCSACTRRWRRPSVRCSARPAPRSGSSARCSGVRGSAPARSRSRRPRRSRRSSGDCGPSSSSGPIPRAGRSCAMRPGCCCSRRWRWSSRGARRWRAARRCWPSRGARTVSRGAVPSPGRGPRRCSPRRSRSRVRIRPARPARRRNRRARTAGSRRRRSMPGRVRGFSSWAATARIRSCWTRCWRRRRCRTSATLPRAASPFACARSATIRPPRSGRASPRRGRRRTPGSATSTCRPCSARARRWRRSRCTSDSTTGCCSGTCSGRPRSASRP